MGGEERGREEGREIEGSGDRGIETVHELESTCFSGQGCGLYIPWIRPNYWAASVAQWLEHLS